MHSVTNKYYKPLDDIDNRWDMSKRGQIRFHMRLGLLLYLFAFTDYK